MLPAIQCSASTDIKDSRWQGLCLLPQIVNQSSLCIVLMAIQHAWVAGKYWDCSLWQFNMYGRLQPGNQWHLDGTPYTAPNSKIYGCKRCKITRRFRKYLFHSKRTWIERDLGDLRQTAQKKKKTTRRLMFRIYSCNAASQNKFTFLREFVALCGEIQRSPTFTRGSRGYRFQAESYIVPERIEKGLGQKEKKKV